MLGKYGSMKNVILIIDTLDKDKETVVVCHHGIRSIRVARYFLSIGFTNIINLKGGLDAWARDIDPSMNTY
jgi:rhodanese-related sulfurtransferase